jgi:hypothetical protein
MVAMVAEPDVTGHAVSLTYQMTGEAAFARVWRSQGQPG